MTRKDLALFRWAFPLKKTNRAILIVGLRA